MQSTSVTGMDIITKTFDMTEDTSTDTQKFDDFLKETKERLDKYFSDLGYVCFMFNKFNHKGESVFVTNSAENVIGVVQPYADAKKLAEQAAQGKTRASEAKAKRKQLIKLRRVK